MEKAWIRRFCRIEGLSHRYINYDNMILSLWFFTYNQDDWADVSDFEDEDEDENENEFL